MSDNLAWIITDSETGMFVGAFSRDRYQDARIWTTNRRNPSWYKIDLWDLEDNEWAGLETQLAYQDAAVSDQSDWRNNLNKMGLEFVLAGDGQHHHIIQPEDDVRFVWDPDSLVLTVYLDEWTCKDLFWDLLETIPKLRHDRR